MEKVLLLLCLFCAFVFSSPLKGQDTAAVKELFSKIKFKYDTIKGIGYEKGCTRRDPSDVIKVGDTYYVYYTKIYGRAPGYWESLWYATSTDDGFTWTEQGEILGLGDKGTFDSQATFTPNILYANHSYYLYYTGVKPTPGNVEGQVVNNATTDITAIGVAISSSPDGPFVRGSNAPILNVSPEPDKFDSYRVDDADVMYRNGLYWLYYKGRGRVDGRGGPVHTQMGTAFSKYPEGPFTKLDHPILSGSHEVMLWQQGTGVGALASLSSTFEYAPDGIDFMRNKMEIKVEDRSIAMGVFRPDLIDRTITNAGLHWGISMIVNGAECYLMRYKLGAK